MKITNYEAICNLGNCINEIYEKAIIGDNSFFETLDGYVKDGKIYTGIIKSDLPKIDNDEFNLRCNQLLLKNLELLEKKIQNLIN